MLQDWTIQPIANPILLAVAALALLALLFFGPSLNKLDRRRRIWLTTIRMLVIAFAFTATLRPGCVQKTERSQSGKLLILADMTRSMELPHREDDSTRYGAMKQMLEENASLLQQLADKDINVQIRGFDNKLTNIELVDGAVQLPEKAKGGETDIGSSVFDSAIEARKERLVGVVVASDGVQNALDPRIELSQAADLLDDMSVPLYAVPFGSLGASGQIADVAVLTLPEQHRIAVKNQLNVQTTVSARGYANQPVKVDLFVTDKDGNEQNVDSVTFLPTQAYVEEKVLLRHIPSEPGQFRMRVRATPNGNELATRNNELPSFLNVYDGGLRVLYLEGNAGWEQMFLRRNIKAAAQDVELVVYTFHTDEQSRKQWPLGGELTRWLKDPTFDVYIINDVDSTAMHDSRRQTENLTLLAEAVDKGKGLMMIGGSHSFGPGQYHSTPLDDVLPIKMNLDEKQDYSADIRRDLHINEPIKLLPTKDHFVTRLGDEDDFRKAWLPLPELAGANYFVGVKDNAEVLLESESGQPILVAGRLGGRVLAFAGDSTWRWAMQDYDAEFKQFWRQMLLWLAEQDGREKNSVWIDLPQRRFQPNAYISFICRASNSSGALIKDARFSAQLVKPDQSLVPLAVDPSSHKGEIEEGVLAEPGVYQIQLSGTHQGKQLGDSNFEFVVFDRDKEKAIAAADPEQMARLAAQTSTHGGRVVLPEDFRELIENLRDSPPEAIMVPLKSQLGQTWQDGACFLLLFTLLLLTEWVLRKKWGLV